MAAVLVGLLWITLGPGPMAFAGGKTIALADYQGPNPTGVPAELGITSLIQRGEYLARAADCEACHTEPGGQPFAGGRAFVLAYGTLYSPNITADKDTGIGGYSDAQFLRALQQGIADDGTHLYPAMPYAAYTYLTSADALALKAYLFSLPPVQAQVRPNSLSFPFNQRWLMGIWSGLFNPDQRFEPNPGRSAQWNRGAYLTEALAHCGECHTPRNPLEALDNRRKFSGAVQSGWRAYNLTPDRGSGIGAWSDEELTQFLSAGHAMGHGAASGPMGEAVGLSLRYLTPGDLAAMVTYLRTVPGIPTSDLPAVKSEAAPASHKEGVAVVDLRGKQIFEGACMGCHDWTGVSPLSDAATLTGVRAVNDATATNVAQIVISGAPQPITAGAIRMPAFGQAYSDSEIAAVANYVTARFGAQPSSITAARVADLRRQDSR